MIRHCLNSRSYPIRPIHHHISSFFRSNSTSTSISLPHKSLTIAKFNFPLATHTINQLYTNLNHILTNESEITLNGHINRKPRIRSSLSFAELRDKNGDLIQLLMNHETVNDHLLTLMKNTTIEDSISVTGIIKLKQQKTPDQPQQIELLIQNYQILNSSNLDASRLDKLKHENPQLIPPQFRYLTLRTSKFQSLLRLRSKISQMIRNILIDNHEFIEIETPLLFKSTPEGAREFLIPTRLQPKKFYALPQSPQQYKQILMSSGFTRYFQLAKCFRDEDLRQDRQPEFTQVDLEMSYINNSNQVGLVVEDLIHNVVNKLTPKSTFKINHENDCLEKIQFKGEPQDQLQFNKIKYIDCLSNYGIDKPDLRYTHKFINLSSYFTSSKSGFPVIECLILPNFADQQHKYKIPHVITDKLNYTKRIPYTISIKTDHDRLHWFQKFIDAGILHPTTTFDPSSLNQLLNLKVGDVIAFSNRADVPYENPTPLGKVRQLVIENFPDYEKRKLFNPSTNTIEDNQLSPNDIFVGSWVVDFPLFNPVEVYSSDPDYPVYDFHQFESTHHPFTMPNMEDYDLLSSDPIKVRGEHYDLVMNGCEVGGGSRRVHDPALQTYIFKQILNINNYDQKFGHLLKALSMGCPPHAGLALGFDRLVAILAGTTNLRDVIAFPKNQSGIDPMVDSPTEVAKDVLQLYHINTIDSDDS
ncbi:tRNA synthetases class II-domain-containing protein [Scheffersomyces coipomensis]|uniref:tRNA synthetases class II-domain-containing protein n=1 Tax=Scheffersomyces coipomensis TaxID=1788519 RepID=UPI00315DB118